MNEENMNLSRQEQEVHQPVQPKISVIVPVYNVAKFLPMCLDSLLFQTMQDIEIILVNDGSPDNSQDVIDEYMRLFPGRIISLKKENGGLSSARKFGFEHASAPYVLFLDSDDYIEYHACEKLWEKAVADDADVVYSAAYAFDEGNHTYKFFGYLRETDYDSILVRGKASIWGLLLRKEYIRQYPIFENMVYEDAATSVAMFSHTRKISVVNLPLFAYIINREGSLTFTNKHSKVVDTIKADEMVWKRCDPKHYPQLAARLVGRIANESKKEFVIYDKMVEHAKDFARRLLPYENEIQQYNAAAKETYYELLRQPDEMFAPVVYLNGFGGIDREAYLERVNMAFIGDYETVWLDEDTCDLAAAPAGVRKHLEAGRTELTAAWFAAEKIAKEGGVYVGADTLVINTFNRLRFDKAFFGFANAREFNGQVFGGQPEQAVWTQLGEVLARPNVESVAQAISWTLCGWGGFHLDGKQQVGRDNVVIYPSWVLTHYTGTRANECIAAYLPQLENGAAYREYWAKAYDEITQQVIGQEREAYLNQRNMVIERDQERARIARELDAAKQERDTAIARRDKLIQDREELTEQRDKARQDRDAAKDKLRQEKAEAAALRDKAKQERAEAKEKAAKLQADLQSLKEASRQERAEAKEKAAKLQADMQSLKEASRQERDTLKEKVAKLLADKADVLAQRDEAKAKVEAVRAEAQEKVGAVRAEARAKVEAVRAEAQEKVEAVRAELQAEMQARHEADLEKNRELQRQLAKLQKELQKEQQRQEALRTKMETLKVDRDRVRQDRSQLRAKYDKLAQESSAMKRERNEAQGQVQLMQNSLSWKLTKPLRILKGRK